MTEAGTAPPAIRSPPTDPGELKLLRIAGRRAALNYLAERNAAPMQRVRDGVI